MHARIRAAPAHAGAARRPVVPGGHVVADKHVASVPSYIRLGVARTVGPVRGVFGVWAGSCYGGGQPTTANRLGAAACRAATDVP